MKTVQLIMQLVWYRIIVTCAGFATLAAALYSSHVLIRWIDSDLEYRYRIKNNRLDLIKEINRGALQMTAALSNKKLHLEKWYIWQKPVGLPAVPIMNVKD